MAALLLPRHKSLGIHQNEAGLTGVEGAQFLARSSMQNRSVFAFETELVFPAGKNGRRAENKNVRSRREAMLNPTDRHDGLSEAHTHEERDLVAVLGVFPG